MRNKIFVLATFSLLMLFAYACGGGGATTTTVAARPVLAHSTVFNATSSQYRVGDPIAVKAIFNVSSSTVNTTFDVPDLSKASTNRYAASVDFVKYYFDGKNMARGPNGVEVKIPTDGLSGGIKAITAKLISDGAVAATMDLGTISLTSNALPLFSSFTVSEAVAFSGNAIQLNTTGPITMYLAYTDADNDITGMYVWASTDSGQNWALNGTIFGSSGIHTFDFTTETQVKFAARDAFGTCDASDVYVISKIPTDGLVLHYTFDQDVGGRVIDESGHANDGYLVGAVAYEDSPEGKAARFTSKSTYIVSDSPKLNMKGWTGFGVSVWVLQKKYTTYGHIINRGSIDSDVPGTFEMAIGRVYGKGELAVRTKETGDELVALVPSSTKTSSDWAQNLPLNRWIHLVLTYDGHRCRYYIDGVLQADIAGTPGVPLWDGSSTKLVIGSISRTPYIGWSDMYFDGLVDEVMIFDRGLSETEIKKLYYSHK